MFTDYEDDKELQKKVFDEVLESIKRGKAVRLNVVVHCALVLGALIVGIEVFWEFDILALAVTIAVASLCTIFAIMSVSAALNGQLDVMSLLMTYYSDRERREAGG